MNSENDDVVVLEDESDSIEVLERDLDESSAEPVSLSEILPTQKPTEALTPAPKKYGHVMTNVTPLAVEPNEPEIVATVYRTAPSSPEAQPNLLRYRIPKVVQTDVPNANAERRKTGQRLITVTDQPFSRLTDQYTTNVFCAQPLSDRLSYKFLHLFLRRYGTPRSADGERGSSLQVRRRQLRHIKKYSVTKAKRALGGPQQFVLVLVGGDSQRRWSLASLISIFRMYVWTRWHNGAQWLVAQWCSMADGTMVLNG